MLNGFIDRIGVNSYIRKLNNKMLRDTYIRLCKKMPKSNIENIMVQCCVKEMNKRGIIYGLDCKK